MTNGEKLKEVFPNLRITELNFHIQVMGENYEFNNVYSLDWWNAEYKESTTKNDLGVDCVSRSTVLTLINDVKNANGFSEYSQYEYLFDQVDMMPSVTTQEPRWIPVSERLPELCDYILASTDAEEIFTTRYLGKMNGGTDCFDDEDGMMWEGDVIAWMPLPKPYKVEVRDKE